MPILGAHASIAGGFDKAVRRAHQSGCDCVQVFTLNTVQWRAKPIAPEEVARFRRALEECRIVCPIGHGSYLINLASPERGLWTRSVKAFAVELRRAEALGLGCLVTHPGSYIDGPQEKGLHRVIRALDAIHKGTEGVRAQCLLETTAGQGTSLGWRFEQLARHTRIGRGKMGLEPFRRLLADPRFQQTPMYLETPKGEEDGEDLDAVNLRVLRRLARDAKAARSLRDRGSVPLLAGRQAVPTICRGHCF